MPPRRRPRVATARAPAAASQNSSSSAAAKVVSIRDVDAFSRLLDRAGEEGVVCVMFTSTWAPNARVLRSLFADLASNARSGFGAEVHFAIVDTGGGENNGGGAASKDGGRAAAALAEQCGVRALPAFQIWLGGDLQRSLGGVEAASVVVSEEEAAAAEAEREAERGRAEVLLRRAAGGVLSQIRRLTGASQKKSSSSSSSFSPVALRTRLAAELRTIAGPPIPSTLWISRVLIQPAGKVYNKRWEVLKVAAAVAAAGAVVGSAVSTRAARRWEREDYETLPTEAHRRRARAQAVERLAGTRARLGGLSFLTPVTYLFRWACGQAGKRGRGGDGPSGPRFPAREFDEIVDLGKRPRPLPETIDFENQRDGDKVKAFLLDQRRLEHEQRRELAHLGMRREVEKLDKEVRRWEYRSAVEHEERKRAEEFSRRRRGSSSSSPSSSPSSPLSPPASSSSSSHRRAVLAGDVEHVDLQGVYRRLPEK